MTDRELLELAAKAAGIKLLFDPHGVPRNCTGMHEMANIFAAPIWNPLTDDGDALRLAVMLRMLIDNVGPIAEAFLFAGEGVDMQRIGCEELIEHHSGDRLAATRRAIVRAAAEIGKAMP